MTDRVVRLFGEEEFTAWAGTIARAALYALTDEHVRHAEMAAASDALTNRRYSELVADVA